MYFSTFLIIYLFTNKNSIKPINHVYYHHLVSLSLNILISYLSCFFVNAMLHCDVSLEGGFMGRLEFALAAFVLL